MPASLYPYCYKGEYRPVKIGNGVLIPTDRQTQDYLLCGQCEDTLNRGGESWMADKLATWERTFPLYDLLTQKPPDVNEEGMLAYFAGNNAEIKAEKIIHFALGLFWKASVHSWKGGEREPRIQLGPYSENIRKWLRGEANFPEHVYLVTVIEKPERAQITLLDPYEGVRQQWRSFFFHVPGLLFMLNVGKTVDLPMRWLCTQNNPGHPIVVSEDLTGNFEKLAIETVKKSRKTTAYQRVHDKIAESRGRSAS